MKVKNVIKGLLQKYNLEEINIISLSDDKVIYSGTVDGWKATDSTTERLLYSSK